MIMSKIRSTGTTPERLVYSALKQGGIGVRRNCRRVLGTPDIVQLRKKRAVFIDGDFWHGYRFPQWKQRLPSDFWIHKIEKNRKRDRTVTRSLRLQGWSVKRVWEHQLAKDFEGTISKLVAFLS